MTATTWANKLHLAIVQGLHEAPQVQVKAQGYCEPLCSEGQAGSGGRVILPVNYDFVPNLAHMGPTFQPHAPLPPKDQTSVPINFEISNILPYDG